MSLAETPLDRARAKCEQLERELRKSPDFQLYLFANSRKNRTRMERLLVEIPAFRLWRALSCSIECTRERPAVSMRVPGRVAKLSLGARLGN
jgi:hypothetical protein